MAKSIQFDNWKFDPDSGDLLLDGETRRLEPKVSKLLAYLLANQGRVIGREELTEKVWSNQIVSDDPINRCVSIIRNILNPSDKNAYIETVPKRGYIANFPISVADKPETTPPRFKFGRAHLAGVTAIVLIVFLFTFQWVDLSEPETSTPSIAIMPFTDLSRNNENQHLAEGMTDTIIHLLSRIDHLHVTSRTSSFAIASQDLTVQQISEALDVDHLLEGSIQINGETIRILTRLIDASTGRKVWSDNFDRKLVDVFPVQDDIAASVVAALKGTVLPASYREYRPEYAAYELVLKGRLELNKMTSDGFEAAQRYFRNAIISDKSYPLPYILLARTIKAQFDTNSYTHNYPSADKLKYIGEAKQLLETALKLEPASGEARNLKGQILLSEGKMVQAGNELKKAVELVPQNANAIADYAAWLQLQNRLDEAVLLARKAATLDPQSNKTQQFLAINLWSSGRAEEAISVIETNIINNPNAASNFALLARWSLQIGQPGNALLYAIEEHKLDPTNPQRRWGICLMHFQLWDFEAGKLCTKKLLEDFPDNYEARKWQFIFSDPPDYVGGIDFVTNQVELFPTAPYYRLQLAELYLFTNQPEKVSDILEPVFPQLFIEDPAISDWSLWAVTLLSWSWIELGQEKRAEKLLRGGLEHIEKSRKLQAGGFSSGVDDVYFLALLGDHEEALSRLKVAIDDNWSMYTMNFDEYPILEPVADDPRFIKLVEQHKQFMQSEREWYKKQLAADQN